MYCDPEIFTKSYEEALKHNQQVLDKIKTFKKELEDVKFNLQENQKQLYQNIMVPIGSKALIKGKLVHTNEVTINLGDRWFVKKSATAAIETCDRMIKRCDLNLAEFEKELNLLSSNLEAPNSYELFPKGDIREIVEPYDEEEEKLWREKHRQKVREYKKQAAASRESDAELFGRLDKLEEEEEKELEFEEDINTDIEEEEYKELIEQSIRMHEIADALENIPEKTLRKRVSFSESLESTQEFSTVIDEDIDVIYFKHSERKLISSNNLISSINTPSDIYRRFIENLSSISRKSILKKSVNANFYEISEIEKNSNENDDVFTNENSSYEGNKMERVQKSIIKIRRNVNEGESTISLNDDSAEEVFGDIVEKKPDLEKLDNRTRPLSSFKKSRIVKN